MWADQINGAYFPMPEKNTIPQKLICVKDVFLEVYYTLDKENFKKSNPQATKIAYLGDVSHEK